jgi:branched-chain amino acid transport system permease protein
VIDDRASSEDLQTVAADLEVAERPEPPGRSRWWVLGGVMVILLVLPLMRSFIGPYNYTITLASLIFMWIAMSSSWNILGGYAGYISLGHSVFMGIGGYFSGVFLYYNNVSPFLTAVFGGLAAVALGFLAGLITWRTRGPSFIISTIALLFMALLIFDNVDYFGGTAGLPLTLPDVPQDWLRAWFYYPMLLGAVGSVLLSYRVAHSKFGMGLRAIAHDETKAEVTGVPTRFYKVMAFALSAFWVGYVGAIYGYSIAFIRPTVFFTVAISARMVLMAIIGGRGTVAGPVIGAALIYAIDEFTLVQFGDTPLNIAFQGGLLVVVLLFFPLGIVGTLRKMGRLPAFLDWD